MRALLTIRNFPSLLSSLFISKLGDYSYEVVFVFIVLEITGSNYILTGVVYFFRFIPFLFFGPIGGWLADNKDIKNTLLFSELIRLIVTCLLFISYFYENINIYILILSSVLTTIGRSVFQPSFRTAIPKIVSNTNLGYANSISQIAEEMAMVLGPLICSFILSITVNKSWVLMFNAITYFLSILIIFNLSKLDARKKEVFNVSRIYKETCLSLDYLYRVNNKLFIVIIGSGICILFTGSVLRFIIPAVTVFLGKGEIFTSYIFSLMAFGTIIGGLIYNKCVNIVTPNKLMFFWVIYGVILFCLAVFSFFSFDIFLPFSFILGVCGAFVDITLVTVIQTYSEKNNIGKNFGIFSTLANTSEALSSLLSGVIAIFSIVFSFVTLTFLIVLTGSTCLALLAKEKSVDETTL
ncbi:MFS transporter [Gallibacterium anatis]|uniref:MFS transporter n=1 Tax=Gallibacterium anatis TaxID=750 RepID=A0AAX3XEK9_9PAST|nr:MFS transporter [Gallibacterium anatis]KGQ56004.1 transporter [Gallibacterium anatis str. Avicor]KGQ66811.1 transporter [Gallibacterium anatis]MDK9430338.1 MFS transporter [Gallibacterium anatis]MDK9561945.1 MFS transporter [Gallibacterium anatis]WIM79896.1 MFS transporter [Gallibacterium anatis]